MKKDRYAYETAKRMLDSHNLLIESLGPGNFVNQGSFALSASWGATASLSVQVGSTFKRGKITVTANGAGIAANPTVTLKFPGGLWKSTPFTSVVRNGGTGTIGFSYGETTQALTITMSGTPVAGQTFTWNYAVRE